MAGQGDHHQQQGGGDNHNTGPGGNNHNAGGGGDNHNPGDGGGNHNTDGGGDHHDHNPHCFFAGTMIRAPHGEVAVETLRRGDPVCTQDGRIVPVDWLGVQTVSTIFTDKLRVLPIRIKAGALGENVPTRDLLVSPDHAILVEGALIQAGALINGSSIVRERNVPTTFTYYHVELDDHSLILAENTPAETFVDNVDRLGFDNWAEHQALYPEGKSISELPYPRAKSHRQFRWRSGSGSANAPRPSVPH